MGYANELVSVTIGSTRYFVHQSLEGKYDIHASDNEVHFRYFGSFDDSGHLDRSKLEKLIRERLRIRTGIPG